MQRLYHIEYIYRVSFQYDISHACEDKLAHVKDLPRSLNWWIFSPGWIIFSTLSDCKAASDLKVWWLSLHQYSSSLWVPFCLWIYLGWEELLFHDSHVQYLLFMWVFPHTWRELEKLRVLPHCFHSWIFLDCESYYICMLSQDKQKSFYIPRAQRTLHRWAFDVFSMKLEN